MQRRFHGYPGGPFLRRPHRPPFGFGRGRLASELLAGGLGYMIGRHQAQNQYPSQPYRQSQPNAQSDQLAQLKLLGQLRESGVLTEEEFQAQKQKILQES